MIRLETDSMCGGDHEVAVYIDEALFRNGLTRTLIDRKFSGKQGAEAVKALRELADLLENHIYQPIKGGDKR